MSQVREQWDFHRSKSTLFPGCIDPELERVYACYVYTDREFIWSSAMSELPGQVSKLGVDGAGDHFCVDSMELVHAIAECDDLSGADERAAKDPKAHSRPHKHMCCDARWAPGMYSQVQRIKEKDQIFPFVV